MHSTIKLIDLSDKHLVTCVKRITIQPSAFSYYLFQNYHNTTTAVTATKENVCVDNNNNSADDF